MAVAVGLTSEVGAGTLGVPTSKGGCVLIVNHTSLPLIEHAVTDYGFELYYVPGKGNIEIKWRQLYRTHGFDEPFKWKFQRFVHIESRQKILPLRPFTIRRFVLHFVYDNVWYGLGFDGQRIIVQNNDGNEPLQELIL